MSFISVSLSILIVNWNSRDYLRKCLETVRATCADLVPQVVVVDGGSFDGCVEMLAVEFPEVEFVQSPDNIGFGRSNNLGFHRVTGEVLLLLNPDTELKPGALRSLLVQLAELPQAGLLGPRLLNANGTLQTSCVQALPTPLNQFLDLDFLRRRFPQWALWGNREAFAARQPVPVEAVSGACMLLHADTFRQLGGFASHFFMYGEDLDLCARVRAAGRKVYHVPGAEVIHHGGGSSGGTFSKFSTVLMRQSVFLFIRSHQGRIAACAYRLLMALSAGLRVLLLAPACCLVGGRSSGSRFPALRKWFSVLRWSVGGERWVRKYA